MTVLAWIAASLLLYGLGVAIVFGACPALAQLLLSLRHSGGRHVR